MTYKDVCAGEEVVWFTLSDKENEGRLFLQWAKELGCVWINGEEIDPEKGTDFFTLSINSDGRLANVPAFAIVSKQFETVKRVDFNAYSKAIKKSAKRCNDEIL